MSDTQILERLNYTSDNLREHIHQLCNAYNTKLVEVEHLPDELCGALPAFRSASMQKAGYVTSIVVAKIVDETTYAIALHELGHIAHPTGSVREKRTAQNINLILLEEFSAWEWAHLNALGWSKKMQEAERLAIETYLEGAKRKLTPMPMERIQDFMRRLK